VRTLSRSRYRNPIGPCGWPTTAIRRMTPLEEPGGSDRVEYPREVFAVACSIRDGVRAPHSAHRATVSRASPSDYW